MTKIEKLCEAMRVNKISYDSSFIRTETRGYSTNECQALADEIVSKMETVLKYGVNNGFNRSMKTYLDELSRLAVNLGEKNAAGKVSKFRARFDENNKALVYSKEVTFANKSPKEVLTELVNVSYELTEAFVENKEDQYHSFYVQSNEKIEKMKKGLDDLWDVTSTDAADRIIEVTNGLKLWLKAVMQNATHSGNLVYLDESLNAFEKLKEQVVLGRKAKDDQVVAVPTTTLRNYSAIVAYPKAREKFDLVERRLQEYENRTKEISLRTTKKMDDIQARINEHEKRNKDLLVAVANGVKTKPEVVGEFNINLKAIDRAKTELKIAKQQSQLDTAFTNNRYEILDSIRGLLDKVRDLVDLYGSKGYFAICIDSIHIDSIMGLLTGAQSAEDFNQVKESIRTAYGVARTLNEQAKQASEDLEKVVHNEQINDLTALQLDEESMDLENDGEDLFEKALQDMQANGLNATTEDATQEDEEPLIIEPTSFNINDR